MQYWAPEVYIENRILEERAESLKIKGWQITPQELASSAVEINANREKIFSGSLGLQPEDKQALDSFEDQELSALPEAWQQPLSFTEDRPETEMEKKETPCRQPITSGLTEKVSLTEKELRLLNDLIERNRKLSPEEEFLNLMIEIMTLEKDLNLY